ncbi:LysM peptidoglycan-binding domain-containing protein [Dyella koreensis]|uniref:LysM peptidoglycan-binding domain-containing protein n=1 Tax=Dyella koreensis TaxID=311235 RepID=A0ABW8K3S0_9GAMM
MAIPREIGVTDLPPQLPPPPPPADKPQPYRVQRNDTLEGIAAHFGTTPEAIQKANPGIGDPSRIMAGDVLTIPPRDNGATTAAAPAAAQTPQQQVDKALADLHEAEQTRPRNRMDAMDLADSRASLQDQLNKAVDAEVQARLQEKPDSSLTPQQRKQLGEPLPSQSERATQIRKEIAGRYPGDADVQKAVDQQEANTLLAHNDNAGYTSPKDKLLALDTALKNASSDQVRTLAASQPSYIKTVQAAADWAAQPYKDTKFTDSRQVEPAAKQAEESSGRYVELLSAMSSPDMRASLVADARPQLEKITHFAFLYDNEQKHSTDILTNLSSVVGTLRQTDPSAAQSLANDLAGQLPDRRIVSSSMDTESMLTYMTTQSGDPTLALTFVDHVRGDGKDRLVNPWCDQTMASLFKTVTDTHQRVDSDTESYVKLTGELNSLIAKEGATMSSDQLNAAIDNYKKLKGPGWEKSVADAQNQLAADGKMLLSQQSALGDWVTNHPGDSNTVGDALNKMLGSQNNQAAIQLAVQNDPTVLTGEQGKSLINLWAQQGKVVDQGGRKLLQELGTNYVKSRMDTLRGELGASNDVASRTRVINELSDLGDNKSLATLLGMRDGKVVDLKAATEVLKSNINDFNALADANKTPDALSKALQDGVKDTQSKLGSIKGFESGTPISNVFRAFSVGAAGLSLANAVDKLGTGKNGTEELRNDMSALISAAGFSQKTAGFVTSMGWAPSDSAWGTVGKRAVDHWVNILSGGIDLWKAGDAFNKGDGTEGALYATTGVGSIMWAAGNAAVSGEGMLGAALGGAAEAGSWAGPIGITMVALGTVGLMAYQSKKDNDHAVPGREAFLQGLGYNEGASKALSSWHSKDDTPAVSMLLRYGQLHGMSDAQTMSWFNGLGQDQQKTFAGALVSSLDTVGGDASKFNRTDRNDGNWDDMAKHNNLLAGNVDHGLFGSGPGVVLNGASIPGSMFPVNAEEQPVSAHQLDVVLKSVLGVDPPPYS